MARSIVPFVALLLVLASCGPAKQCRRASGMVARATRICPELLRAQTEVDTIPVVMPGSAGSGAGVYSAAQMDSVLAACQQLAYSAAEHADMLAPTPESTTAVRTLRTNLCSFDRIVVADTHLLLQIWAENGQVKYWYHVLPRIGHAVVKTTVPQVVIGNGAMPTGVASWYRWAFWLIVLAIAAYIVVRFLGKGWGLLLLAMAPCAANAQVFLETQVEAKKGERVLNVQGFFRDADTVLVQVYHDGDVLAEEVRIFTWAFTLGAFESYTLKFTDGRHRVKRLYILELSDDQVEFVPPIEVDFDVPGNLVLIKERDRQPDFLLYNVGMSRKK